MTADQAHMEAGPVIDLSGRWLGAALLAVLAVWLIVACAREAVARHRASITARDRRWAARNRIEIP
jgi:hypothetical protein